MPACTSRTQQKITTRTTAIATKICIIIISKIQGKYMEAFFCSVLSIQAGQVQVYLLACHSLTMTVAILLSRYSFTLSVYSVTIIYLITHPHPQLTFISAAMHPIPSELGN